MAEKRKTKKENKDFKPSVLQELLTETDDFLRDEKRKESILNDAIIQAELRIKANEEKADPNRSLFHISLTNGLEQETDNIRKELFAKKEEQKLIQSEIQRLEERKAKLHELLKQQYRSTILCEEAEEPDDDIKTKLLKTQELERNRIANDLHDSTVQNLTTLIHKTELIEHLIDIDPVRAKIELLSINDTVRNIIQEMREIIFDLRPMSISDLGLWASIRTYVDNVQQNCELQIKVEISKTAEALKLEDLVSMTIYKTLQEAVNNCIKHARASKVELSVEYDGAAIVISVKDDGIGFSLEEVSQKEKYGLKIMQERTNLLSGKMEINTSKRGTELFFRIPVMNKGETN